MIDIKDCRDLYLRDDPVGPLDPGTAAATLAVGFQPPVCLRDPLGAPSVATIGAAAFMRLHRGDTGDWLSGTVLAPLIAEGTEGVDAIDIAGQLMWLGFTGRLVIVAWSVANGDMIRREIGAAMPGSPVQLLEIAHTCALAGLPPPLSNPCRDFLARNCRTRP